MLDLTAAYTVFPRGGEWIEPFGIMEVTDHRGRIVWNARPQKRLVMSREGAAIITDMLQGVVLEGTGRRARTFQVPLAGKTGTTDNYKDALFVGFSPAVAAGVWVGCDSGEALGDKETGAKAALPIWIQLMQATLAGGSAQSFDIPDDVVKVAMNPLTGQLERDDTSQAVSALFRVGTEPQ